MLHKFAKANLKNCKKKTSKIVKAKTKAQNKSFCLQFSCRPVYIIKPFVAIVLYLFDLLKILFFKLQIFCYNNNMEIAIIKFLQGFRCAFLDTFMQGISFLGSYVGILIFFLLFLIFANKKFSFWFLLTVLINLGINFLLKIAIARQRPYVADNSVANITNSLGLSMPSGHTVCIVTIIFFVICFCLLFCKNKKISMFVYFICAIMFLCVAISRMYLGQHYISDLAVATAVASILSVISLKLFLMFNH